MDRAAGRGFYSNFPPEVPQQLYDNADGINRFTASGTLNNRRSRLVHSARYRRYRLHRRGRACASSTSRRRNSPRCFSAATAGGRIGQTLRHNAIITADYSGTAKFESDVAHRVVDRRSADSSTTPELNTSVLAATGFPAPGVETVTSGSPWPPTQIAKRSTRRSAHTREQQFAWHDRLFVTAGLRVDNNSAFGDDFKWVTYPKVSASWVVSEEPFWQLGDKINTLRLRAAYGESGRQPAAFSALRTFSTTPGPGGVITVTPGSAGNPELRPERGKEIELGFETGLFKRLTLSFTYFNKRTIDEIVSQTVAPSSGFPGSTARQSRRGAEQRPRARGNIQGAWTDDRCRGTSRERSARRRT